MKFEDMWIIQTKGSQQPAFLKIVQNSEGKYIDTFTNVRRKALTHYKKEWAEKYIRDMVGKNLPYGELLQAVKMGEVENKSPSQEKEESMSALTTCPRCHLEYATLQHHECPPEYTTRHERLELYVLRHPEIFPEKHMQIQTEILLEILKQVEIIAQGKKP